YGRDGASPFRDVGLAKVDLGHVPSEPSELRREERLDLGMPDQRHAQCLGQALPGDVVLGRTKAPGGDHDVCSRERQAESFGDPRLLVPHGLMVQHVDADLGQPLRDPLSIVVADLAGQDFGPHADDLGSHGACGWRRGGSMSTAGAAAFTTYWTPVTTVKTRAATSTVSLTSSAPPPNGRMYRVIARSCRVVLTLAACDAGMDLPRSPSTTRRMEMPSSRTTMTAAAQTGNSPSAARVITGAETRTLSASGS